MLIQEQLEAEKREKAKQKKKKREEEYSYGEEQEDEEEEEEEPLEERISKSAMPGSRKNLNQQNSQPQIHDLTSDQVQYGMRPSTAV